MIGKGRHLGQMGNTEHLSILGNILKLLPNGAGRYPANTGIDLVENQCSDMISPRCSSAQSQHNTRQFAPRSNPGQRFGVFAKICGQIELTPFQPARPWLRQGKEAHLKLGLGHGQLGQLPFNSLP